ncbi:MAG: hypothetical protein PHE25_02535 [Candidatus Gracilibacteria bacterium]|nr:hypothetical protein [Candidatus Gracilibacteria bacterium]
MSDPIKIYNPETGIQESFPINKTPPFTEASNQMVQFFIDDSILRQIVKSIYEGRLKTILELYSLLGDLKSQNARSYLEGYIMELTQGQGEILRYLRYSLSFDREGSDNFDIKIKGNLKGFPQYFIDGLHKFSLGKPVGDIIENLSPDQDYTFTFLIGRYRNGDYYIKDILIK